MSALSTLRWLAVVLAAVLPLSVAAQTIPVRSGEHDGFTRLVLDIGPDRQWRLEGEGPVRRLVLDPPVGGFAIGQVFDLIPRTRLAALAADDGLVLSLACPCDVAASRYQDRYLVLDIRPAAEGQPRPDAAPDPEAEARRAAAAALPDMARLLTRPTGPDLRPGPAVDRDPAPAPGSDPGPDPGSGTTAPAVAIDLDEAARIMAEQLARAAAAGLLDAAPGRPMADADPADLAPPPPPPVTPAPVTSPAAQVPASLPIRAETAIDAALHHALGAEPQQNRLACRGEAMLIGPPASGGGVQVGLGALRLALYDARDVLQRDAVLALAGHYLAHGFGAEAAFWLGQIDAPPPDLVALAGLVDGRPGPHFPPEPDATLCSDDEFLWRYLDGAFADTALTAEQAGRLQRATAALSPVLRDQLVPRVARALQADGHPDSARNLRDMLARGGRVAAPELLRLDLDLGLAGPGDPEARDALALALRDDGGDPVTAIAHALAFDREAGLPPDPVRLAAAEALLRENGGGADTPGLWQELILAQAARGDLGRVIELLAEPRVTPERRDAALTRLLADRLAAADTAALYLVARVHGADWQARGSEAGRLRVAVMAQLRSAGFPAAADALRAGQRVLTLPAGPGDAPTEAERLAAAWQAEDWQSLGALAGGPHRAIATRMAEGPASPPPSADPPDLPALAARLADSRALRAEIAALLAQPTPSLAEPLE
jgi:hypothetical protein